MLTLKSMLTITDPMTQAWVIGFFSCLMTVFPISMLLLIPHDGWGRYLPSNQYKNMQKEIVHLKKELYLAQIEAKLAQKLLLD